MKDGAKLPKDKGGKGEEYYGGRGMGYDTAVFDWEHIMHGSYIPIFVVLLFALVLRVT